ncbi:MAG: hypothetical protein RBU37_00600 [Myxococcota bacterium]|jgi:hypothetical protein|nr:hypothetical protein [Myxococcota bacterium]
MRFELATISFPQCSCAVDGILRLLVRAVFGLWVFALSPLCFASFVQASEQDLEEASSVELIQAVNNAQLGQLNVPAFWEVSELEDGLRAVESQHARPAVLELGQVSIPEALSMDALAEALRAELGGVSEREREQLAKEKGVEQLYVMYSGEESGQPMLYAFVLVGGSKRVLMASLSLPAERESELEPKSLLLGVLASIH